MKWVACLTSLYFAAILRNVKLTFHTEERRIALKNRLEEIQKQRENSGEHFCCYLSIAL